MTPRVPRRILPAIVAAQFAGSSVWFAGNAILPALQQQHGLPATALGEITIAVQLGFIVGTLIFAWTALSDRFSPRLIFLLCALCAALANAAPVLLSIELTTLLVFRFATGLFLAGIYPVGMKIASGWFDRHLGHALGFLVGALVLGTALPHLLRAIGPQLDPVPFMLAVSAIAAAGGILMLLAVPDGPHLKRGAQFDPRAFAAIFRSADFRASAFGCFGHMWELYAFFAFVPSYLAAATGLSGASLSFWSFAAIAAGAFGCIAGGYLSRRIGSVRVAFIQLAASGLCCLLAPLAFVVSAPVLLAFIVFWGVVISGDSPQFSALNARHAPPLLVGSALTIANSIGFAITIVSIAALDMMIEVVGPQYVFWLLVPGPVLGLMALRRLSIRQP